MAESDDETTIVEMDNDDGAELMDISMDDGSDKTMFNNSTSMSEESPPELSTLKEIADRAYHESLVEFQEEEDEEEEEGEIMDEDDTSLDGDNTNIFGFSTTMNMVSSAPASKAIFTTGVNIFDKKEQEKLQERAKRFALKPEEIKSINKQDLEDLHESLGINSRNINEVKFEIVHLLGLDSMTAADIVDYFSSYAPEGIEWLDHKSCNIVWLDDLSAARALYFLSRMVKGMPARAPKDTFPKEFLDNVEDDYYDAPSGQSILIKEKNREIALQNEIANIIRPKKKTYPSNAVDISEISIRIPPGYWRLGVPHPKTRGLLMRFGNLADKIPFKKEKCVRYYKILSNPSSQRRSSSETQKKEHKKSIFDNNKELTLKKNKNPWGSLARNWDKDSKFRERDPIMYKDKVPVIPMITNSSLRARLGIKREFEDEQTENQEETHEKTNGKKKSKVPRMTMYADEEEDKRKKKQILNTIRNQEVELTKNDVDLRNMLGPSKRLLMNDKIEPDPNADLGLRLKNRSQKIRFAVDNDIIDDYDPADSYDDESHRYPNIRVEIPGGKNHVEQSFTDSEEEIFKFRSPLLRSSVEREISSRRGKPNHSRNRTPQRRLPSERSFSRRATPYRRDYSPGPTHSRNRSHSPRRNARIGSKFVKDKVIKKPNVASTIWSKVAHQSETDASEQSDVKSDKSSTSSSDSSQSSSESSDSDTSTQSFRRIASRNPDRPEFGKSKFRSERAWKK